VDGGSVVTSLGYDIRVNDGSSLRRAWVVLNEAGAPARLDGVGVSTAYGDRAYRYVGAGRLVSSEPLTAVEVRILLFDVFGNHMKTLSGTQVTDLAAGASLEGTELGQWRAFENEVSELLTSVAFVAHVRTSDGRVWRHDAQAIRTQLDQIQLRVSEGDLSPSSNPGGD
jgi:hypothetical protein